MLRFEGYVTEILTAFGLQLDTPGTRRTPTRFLKALYDATAGYEGDHKLMTVFRAEHRCDPDHLVGQVLNNLMGRGVIPPVVHGVLDYALAAVLLVLPFVLGFDDAAATWIAFAIGIGAAVLAVGTAWSTGIVRVIPPLLHGYADLAVLAALIVLPFIVGFWDDTTALVFYLIVGAGGLVATLATRFEPGAPAESRMMLRPAA